MKKSFKRSVAVVLSVLMIVCSMPMTALAAAGTYAPDIQLQFNGVWDPSYSEGPFMEQDVLEDFSASGIYGPAVDLVNGSLVASADKYAAWNANIGVEELEDDYTLTEGDVFSVSVRVDNISKLAAFEAAISYSDNIAPYTNGIDGALPVEGQGAADLYSDVNAGLIGDLSYVDVANNVIIASAYASNGTFANVAQATTDNDLGLTNPATGEGGYTSPNSAIIATFVFQIVGDGAITFGIYQADSASDKTYGGAYYVADTADGTAVADYTTYEPVDGAAGSTKMTFMGRNQYTTSAGATITFIDANGEVISSTEYTIGDTVTVPALPVNNYDTAKHYSYAWDVQPATVAEADATYTVVKTAANHSYTSSVVTNATCNSKGTTKYTCACGYEYTAQDIPATGNHVADAAVRENEVPATCSQAGSYDSVVKCKDCGAVISSEHCTIDPLPHTEGTYTYDGNATTTTDGTKSTHCTVCNAPITETVANTSKLAMSKYSLSLASSISMNVRLVKADAQLFSGIYATATRNNKTTVLTDYVETTNSGVKYYTYTFNGIAPQTMGDDIDYVVHANVDGLDVWGPTYTQSVKGYAYTYLKGYLNVSSQRKLMTLLVDLLNYGAAAQTYTGYNTNALVNAELTSAMIAVGTAANAVPTCTDTRNYSYATISNPSVTIETSNLLLDAAVTPRIRIVTSDLSNLAVEVKVGTKSTYTYTYAENPELFVSAGSGKYYFAFPALNANNMRVNLYFRVLRNGVAVSNTTLFTVESYVAAAQNGLKASPNNATYKKLVPLVNAMMKYGDSAAAYQA